MKKFFIENKYLIILWIVCIAFLSLFLGHYINILIDFGREVYYPERILDGKVLYKDLFNIYGPFSYMFNAVLYKICGINLKTLYLAGSVCSLLTVSGIYLIAKRFLNEFLSFTIAMFTIVTGVSTAVIFNFSFPYSWAMLYGLVCFLYSVLFLLKFQTENKPLYLYISALLAGVCVASKYEFVLYSLLVIFFIVKTKNLKVILKAFGTFLLIPVLCFGTLFLQGLTISDLISSFKIVKAMAESQTLKYFYQDVGVYFHIKTIPFLLVTFFKTTISFGSIMLAGFLHDKYWDNNANLSPIKNILLKISVIIFTIIAIFSCFLLTITTQRITFAFLPLLIIIFGIFKWKKLSENHQLLILIIAAVLVSLKSLWGMIVLSYGTYYAGIMLLAFFAMLFQFVPTKYQKNSGIYLLIVSFYFIIINITPLHTVTSKINTNQGTVHTYSNLETATNDVLTYLKYNSKKQDRVVIFPEGMMINFLAQRKSDDFYNSLLPMYVEVFQEDKIIEHFTQTKPEFIILNNEPMKDYGFNTICNDYAQGFCQFVIEHYTPEKTIDYGNRFLIYKIKS